MIHLALDGQPQMETQLSDQVEYLSMQILAFVYYIQHDLKFVWHDQIARLASYITTRCLFVYRFVCRLKNV